MPYTARPGINWNDVATGVAVELRIQDFEKEQRAAAIRWQGAQDYQTLVKSGVDSGAALRRTASKLFFNDPQGLSKTALTAEQIRLRQTESDAAQKFAREKLTTEAKLTRERIAALSAPSIRAEAEKRGSKRVTVGDTVYTIPLAPGESPPAPPPSSEDQDTLGTIAELDKEAAQHQYWITNRTNPDPDYGFFNKSRQERLNSIAIDRSQAVASLSPAGRAFLESRMKAMKTPPATSPPPPPPPTQAGGTAAAVVAPPGTNTNPPSPVTAPPTPPPPAAGPSRGSDLFSPFAGFYVPTQQRKSDITGKVPPVGERVLKKVYVINGKKYLWTRNATGKPDWMLME